MAYGAYTNQTVGEAVDLANLFADGEATAARVGEVLALYRVAPGELDLDAFAALADHIRAIFSAGETSAVVARLNRLIEAAPPSPRLVEHDGQDPHFHYVTVDGPAVDHVTASFAMALANVVVDFGHDRFGRCDAPGCPHIFLDQTRGGRQRFCSKTCATRVHVAAHRARA